MNPIKLSGIQPIAPVPLRIAARKDTPLQQTVIRPSWMGSDQVTFAGMRNTRKLLLFLGALFLVSQWNNLPRVQVEIHYGGRPAVTTSIGGSQAVVQTPTPTPVVNEEYYALYSDLAVPRGVFPVTEYAGVGASHDQAAYWFGDGLHRGQDIFGKTAVSMWDDNEVIYIGPHQLDNADHTIGKGTAVITRKRLRGGLYLYTLYAHLAPQTYVRNNPDGYRLQRGQQDGIDPTIRVRVGEVLRAGQPIADLNTYGYMQSASPDNYAPHLHIETFVSTDDWQNVGCDSPYPDSGNAQLIDTTAVLGNALDVPEGFKQYAQGHIDSPIARRATGYFTGQGVCDFLPDHAFPEP